MTRDEIIRMAQEAGASEWSPGWHLFTYDLERFFQLAYEAGRKDEQERCAHIADAHATIEGIAQTIAAEIRSAK